MQQFFFLTTSVGRYRQLTYPQNSSKQIVIDGNDKGILIFCLYIK